jgi:hypothetical protein
VAKLSQLRIREIYDMVTIGVRVRDGVRVDDFTPGDLRDAMSELLDHIAVIEHNLTKVTQERDQLRGDLDLIHEQLSHRGLR